MNEITFADLCHKEVVNICDGRKLGRIIDIVFEQCSGKILGFVVPGERKLFSFKGRQDIFIPYHNICKLGEDVILIDIVYNMGNCCEPCGKGRSC